MKRAPVPLRMWSVATFLGLLTAAFVCLCASALLAVTREGLPRLLLASVGFSGYVFFFAHALRELALPRVLVESRPAPDGEVVRTLPVFQEARENTDRNHALTAAA